MAACGPEQGSLLPPTGTGAGGTALGAGGATGASSSTTVGAGGDTSAAGQGGTGGTGGKGGSAIGSDDAGSDADPGDGGVQIPACVFHTDPVVEGGTSSLVANADDGGAGDAGGTVADATSDGATPDAVATSDASARSEGGTDGGARGDAADSGPAPSVTVLTSAFLGPYLADSAGRTLYTYGGDQPGDCNYAPISGCERDCLVAWPLFDASARTLAAGLDDRAFGRILRADGSTQTTYFGWPLYYYKPDVAPGQLTGQAKAKTWHAATVVPVGIVIMKNATFDKYLADGGGRTLYVFDQDTKGTGSADPVSVCTGSCSDEHPVFMRSRISVVSSLAPTDFSIFVQGQARQQLAYKGAPLYYAAADARSGDQNGATTSGWSVAVP
jgi:predicted lipoprotein with Yx(FWY)xxD motif